MKHLLLFLIIGFLFPHLSAQLNTIDINGVQREYILHIPDNLPSGEKYPCVIALHLLGSTAESFEGYTKFSKKADNEGFIAVYPQGLGNSWNAGACCDYAMENEVDDISFISQLIDTLIATSPVDTNKVFLAGFSNGAILSYALASHIPDKLAGIAAVGGLLAQDMTGLETPLPIIHFHALNDGSVKIGGMWDYPSVYNLLDDWSDINGIVAETDTFRTDHGITGTLYPSPDSTSNILLYTSTTGGHQWEINGQLGTTNRIWEFFSTGINIPPVLNDTLSQDEIKRDFLIHIPANYHASVDTSQTFPLVIATHGWYQDPVSMEEITGLSKVGDSEGFFITYLHYVGPPPDNSWNYFMDPEKPQDIAYAKSVIDTMFARYPIDSSMVFAAGFSDGCGLANRLPLETDGLVSAIGSVGGMVTFDDTVETTPVRMIHFHAKNDPSVSYSNVRNTNLNYWLEVNNCSNEPDTVISVDGYVGEAFKNADEDTVILFYTLPWNQHSWPVKNKDGMRLSASALMWEFFSTGSAIPNIIPTEPDALQKKPGKNQVFVLYPNPVESILNIEITEAAGQHIEISIYNLQGQKVFQAIRTNARENQILQFDLSEIPAGLYTVKLESDGLNKVSTIAVK